MSEPDFSAAEMEAAKKTISTSDWATSLFGANVDDVESRPRPMPETADLIIEDPPVEKGRTAEDPDIEADDLVAPDLPRDEQHAKSESHPLDDLLATFLAEGHDSKSSPALVGRAMDLLLQQTKDLRIDAGSDTGAKASSKPEDD